MIIDPNGQLFRGGIPLKRVPVIPWDAFSACGLKVFADGRVQLAIFEPQPMVDAEEVFQTIRLLLAAQGQKPGPVDWESVPEIVKKHFRFKSDESGIKTR